MPHSNQSVPLWIGHFVLPLLFSLLLYPAARCQDGGSETATLRGNRAELAITVRDISGQPIAAPAMVRLYRSGAPADQAATSKGRVFFVLPSLGDYMLIVDAPGYKTQQKEVSIQVALKAEIDVVLVRDPTAEGAPGVPGRPLLAPKAKEAFDKGLQALSQDKVKDAEKYVAEAMRLAPGHPDVLYIQGVLYLKQHNWPQAQSVLEKATQIDPSHARAFAALGMALSNQGNYDAAIPPLERSLQLDAAAGWETHLALAKAYYHHAQYDAALKASQQALAESNGKGPEIEILVAQSLTALGRYEDSARALREFLRNHPDRPEATTARRYLERLTADGKIRPE
jgi:tetratricopeptide (TPR) repeat protein